MKFQHTSTIQEILEQNFSAGKIFAENGIPFPYYLKFSLGKICERKKLDPKIILSLIHESTSIPYIDYLNQPVKILIGKILLEYHDYSRKRLALAEKSLSILVKEYTSVYPRISEIEEDFLLFVEEFESHLLREEQAIFPEIISLDELLISTESSTITKPDSLDIPLENMERQHIEQEHSLETILKDAKKLAAMNTDNIHIKKYSSEIHEFYINICYHVYFENEILFKRARRIENSFYFKVANP